MENEMIDLSRSKHGKDEASALIDEQLGNSILSNIDEEKRQRLYHDLISYLAVSGKKEEVSGRDAFNIILGTTLVSTVAGLVVILPFIFVGEMYRALTISNWLGIFLLFVIGYFRTYEKKRSERLRSGFVTAVVGMMIAAVTVILGG